MQKLQVQGVHHITLVGANRQTSIDFWEGVLGMPFVFEQPNLDVPEESHLYFDPGDGRLITVFTNENRKPDPTPDPTEIGCVHHIAFSVSHAIFAQAVERLDERGISHSGVKDRGFMDSIYFRDPLGLLIELASYRFFPPEGRVARRGHARGASHPGCPRRLQHPAKFTSPTRSRTSSGAGAAACRTIARRRIPTEVSRRELVRRRNPARFGAGQSSHAAPGRACPGGAIRSRDRRIAPEIRHGHKGGSR